MYYRACDEGRYQNSLPMRRYDIIRIADARAHYSQLPVKTDLKFFLFQAKMEPGVVYICKW